MPANNDVMLLTKVIEGLLIVNESLELAAPVAEREEFWRVRRGYEELHDWCEAHMF